MFEDLPATRKMPQVGTKPAGRTKSSSPGFGARWLEFRCSLYVAVRSSGAWFLATCVGALAVSVSWFGWLMKKVSDAAVETAEIGGRSVQITLPAEEGGIWLSLTQIHAGWFVGVPVACWLAVIVFKEVK